MDVTENRITREETVILDGKKFINCQMVRCHMVYRGGEFALVNTTFEDCDWTFFDAARHTIDLLSIVDFDIKALVKS